MDSKPEVDYLKEAKAVCDELKAELGKEVIRIKAEKVDDLAWKNPSLGAFLLCP